MLTIIFWDSSAVLLVDCLEHGQPVNPNLSCHAEKLAVDQEKNPSLLSNGAVLHHDNTELHMELWTWNLLQIYVGKYWTIPCTVCIWHLGILICFVP